ncbi:hypothetical protein ACNJX9_34195 [Bradyrhizobium sp. DASA03076]|uniref:hypothetical protein n=1 Tax=Bradyrhizobium sp. BLXBL-03 TaxID=3395916 RepID=UPI003F7193A3
MIIITGKEPPTVCIAPLSDANEGKAGSPQCDMTTNRSHRELLAQFAAGNIGCGAFVLIPANCVPIAELGIHLARPENTRTTGGPTGVMLRLLGFLTSA